MPIKDKENNILFPDGQAIDDSLFQEDIDEFSLCADSYEEIYLNKQQLELHEPLTKAVNKR